MLEKTPENTMGSQGNKGIIKQIDSESSFEVQMTIHK